MIIVHIIVSSLIAYPILSLMEYMVHRHLMHKKAPGDISQNGFLSETFYDHAITHHGRCYAVFDREEGSCAGVNIPITSLMAMVVPCLIVYAIDPKTSAVLLIGALVGGRVWSEIHSEMHRPKGAWFASLKVYLYLKRRHFLHHRHPNTNFNTLLPMWDSILRTTSVGTDSDRLAMHSAVWRVRPMSRDQTHTTS
jgi:hypothetical protein